MCGGVSLGGGVRRTLGLGALGGGRGAGALMSEQGRWDATKKSRRAVESGSEPERAEEGIDGKVPH